MMVAEPLLPVLWAKHEALEKLLSERQVCAEKALELQAQVYHEKEKRIDTQIAAQQAQSTAQQKLLWIGLGITLALQFAIGIAVMIWRK